MPGGKLYAVRVGRQPGIYTTWAECQKHIDVPGAKYKSFMTQADAEAFLQLADGPKAVSAPPAANPVAWQPLPGAAPVAFNPVPPVGPPVDYTTGTHIWTDGSCVKNVGGWAYVVYRDGQLLEEQFNFLEDGPNGEKPTNNRAALTAILRALQSVHAAGPVTIHSDSEFSINCLTKWAGAWERNGWVTKAGQPVKNPDLIKACLGAYNKNLHTFHHVFGHVGIPGNERADQLANQGRLLTPRPDPDAPVTPTPVFAAASTDYDIPDDY